MGKRNYIIDGVSCSGKTTVGKELERRGYHVIHGDDELAYWDENRNWIWNVEKVNALVSDQSHAITFFCGGCRNSNSFKGLMDGAFVLEIDLDMLNDRLASRPSHEWGGTASEGAAFARRQHATREGFIENATLIDAMGSVSRTVEAILGKINLH